MVSIRKACLLGLFLCTSVLGFSIYLQFGYDLHPCPLCDLQRITFAVLFLMFLFAAVHNPGRSGALVYSALLVLLTIVGGILAGRQIWLQHQPPGSVPECGFGLDYLLQSVPLLEALQTAFKGSSQCANVEWSMLGLSIAEWSMAVFVLLFIIASRKFVQVLRSPRR